MDKTEEQIAKDKAAIDAMKNAKANMDAALARITDLERGLSLARDAMARFKSYVPAAAYVYDGRKKLHEAMDEDIARATKLLG